MADDMSALLSGAFGVAAAGGAAGLTAALARRGRAWRPGAHALPGADPDPLRTALRLGFGGATVPVRPGPRDELFAGAGEPAPGRTVRRLVLQPLAELARRRGGRLHPRQRRPFELVLEFTGPERDAGTLLRAYLDLDRQLRDHPAVFSRCVRGTVSARAVTVLIAGTVDVRGLLAGQDRRYAFADGTLDDVGSAAGPPHLVPALGEPWARRFGWDGTEELSAVERHYLHGLVAEAHAEGRTVRIGGLPRPRRFRAAFLAELGAAGVDAVADADLGPLARHVRPLKVNNA
ncbi:hypothetical protein [Spirilliplanes yamanashiensis]|uniref:Uncharacterized protein n=1 Tax=Spirilliplanes yamanashiensis TaxID=42233 RepID=A0A8J3Y5G1_9ACTN|nr:hypothetical protein [Spirilliplanes yamanashiensis]MDP9814467.1 hypothetical protein [Spirilliplanes yamanashiensis]GIJ02118.1 hypothetical protein Sya03_14700 [Spirilliplanes yamanashiensis]